MTRRFQIRRVTDPSLLKTHVLITPQSKKGYHYVSI